jgi:N-acetylglutamate synthase-like GNAT family acetyltransferase
MHLRSARIDETHWINDQYARVHFLPSDLHRETVIIAELDGERAGMGRLVPAGEKVFELGGMLVFEGFRGRGVARAIVDELLRRAGDADVYCVPFADLETLYAAAGFRATDPASAPEKVREKYDWCVREMGRAVTLMKLTT